MKMNALSTNVIAVPTSDHQRMYSSVLFGKPARTKAKTLGMKMHSDIITRSYSIIMEAISYQAKLLHPPSRLRLYARRMIPFAKELIQRAPSRNRLGHYPPPRAAAQAYNKTHIPTAASARNRM